MTENAFNETDGRLNGMFDKVVLSRSDAIALIYEDRRISFFELQLYVEWMSGYFQSINLQPGQRVALLVPNSPKLVISFFGLMRAGGVAVPLDVSSEAHELRSALLLSKADAVITTPEYKPLLDQALAKSNDNGVSLSRLTIAIFEEDNIVTLNKAMRERCAEVDRGKMTTVNRQADRQTRLGPTNGSAHAEETVPVSDRPAVIQFSRSGKFCVHTHENLTREAGAMIERIRLTGDDHLLCLVPLSQPDFLSNFLIASIAAGGTLVLSEVPDWESVLQTLAGERITVLVSPPALLIRLAENNVNTAFSLRWCFCAGAPLSSEIAKRLQQKLGFNVEQLTETINTGIPQQL